MWFLFFFFKSQPIKGLSGKVWKKNNASSSGDVFASVSSCSSSSGVVFPDSEAVLASVSSSHGDVFSARVVQ